MLRARNIVLVTFVSQKGVMLAMEMRWGIKLEGYKLEVYSVEQRII